MVGELGPMRFFDEVGDFPQAFEGSLSTGSLRSGAKSPEYGLPVFVEATHHLGFPTRRITQ
jgi:hypothetical protein